MNDFLADIKQIQIISLQDKIRQQTTHPIVKQQQRVLKLYNHCKDLFKEEAKNSPSKNNLIILPQTLVSYDEAMDVIELFRIRDGATITYGTWSGLMTLHLNKL